VTFRGSTGNDAPPAGAAVRVGLFGLFGAGNLGNDGSLEAFLNYLRADHPDAILDAMCSGPKRLKAQFGIATTPRQWFTNYSGRTSGATAIGLKALGKGIDAFRTAAWVRRHDVVIVPGTGILETSLPIRPWGTPYGLLLVCASGRLFGTKVALVSVGASAASQRLTRYEFMLAARLACYRSYRDAASREAMRRAGLDITRDLVYPDLVFALPTPPDDPGAPVDDPGVTRDVAVGVMAYHGGSDDRRRADEIHARYVKEMKRFVRWLVDDGRGVRLLGGADPDDAIAQEIAADVRADRPGLEPARVVAGSVNSLTELMQQMSQVSAVVATRYHNVLCALKLSKPTLSISYAAKSDALMADMGVSEFCHPARSLDADRLIAQFTELEHRSEQISRILAERNTLIDQRLNHQFSMLSAVLFQPDESAVAPGGQEPARERVR
jgi:polysaccharide pyruvyl transferase WcaK-like protein